jgi:two-component system, NtrC family, sensor kinase
MKLFFKIVFLLLFSVEGLAQNPLYREYTSEGADSLRKLLKTETNDTVRMVIAKDLCYYYQGVNWDSSALYAQQELDLALAVKQPLWQSQASWFLALASIQQSNFPKAFGLFKKAIEIAEDEKCEENIWGLQHLIDDGNPRHARLNVLSNTINDRAHLYGDTGNREKQIAGFYETVRIAALIPDTLTMAVGLGNLSKLTSNTDSMEYFIRTSMSFGKAVKSNFVIAWQYLSYAYLYLQKKNFKLAEENGRESLRICKEKNLPLQEAAAKVLIGRIFEANMQFDSAVYYYQAAKPRDATSNSTYMKLSVFRLLASAFTKANQRDSALHYYQLALPLSDSLNAERENSLIRYQTVNFDDQLRVQELEKERVKTKGLIRTYFFAGGIAVLFLIGLLLYRNNRQNQRKNKELQEKNEKIETTLMDLKATQAQLIQSEKMASLGELTAGIAHEIQNPLNFVNNFSEVNKELISELVDEVEKGHTEEVKSIAADIRENSEKINHHGKRADAIVKGMLQHSRAGSGKKEPTDINTLCDEYLRLAYHGLRAKDKSFNATMKTSFDASIGKVDIIPQEIGRVVLNLITNAFYAVQHKKKTADAGYEPTVSISTASVQRPLGGRSISIKVSDNGGGIPPEILDKIFQPFFTTKPTGQGTGLGLSMSYDIVTKGHGGELLVESREGEYTLFTIILPL